MKHLLYFARNVRRRPVQILFFSIKISTRIVLINIQVTCTASLNICLSLIYKRNRKNACCIVTMDRRVVIAEYIQRSGDISDGRQYGDLHKRQIINKTTHIVLRPSRISRKIILWKNLRNYFVRNNTGCFLILRQIINKNPASAMSYEFIRFQI